MRIHLFRTRAVVPLLLLSAFAPSFAHAQRVVVWGDFTWGQWNVPIDLFEPSFVSASGKHALAIRPNGTVAAWGDDLYGQSEPPPRLTVVTGLAAGGLFSLALRSNGKVIAWGDDTYGECDVPTGLRGATQVAAGSYHALALRPDGTVAAWGDNSVGQLLPPRGLAGVTQISAGGSHSLALRSNGTVAAWGQNDSGQSDVPAGLTGVSQIAAGFRHNLALMSDHTVAAWGHNGFGESTVPVGLSGVVQVAAGFDHSLALKSDGTVTAWGQDANGESDVPAGLTGVLQVAAGGEDSYALVAAAHIVLSTNLDYGGSTPTATVKLSDPAGPGGRKVFLTCDDPGVHLPPYVIVPSGMSSISFPVPTDVTFTNRVATLSTSYKGTATVPFHFTVLNTGGGLSLNQTDVFGGSTRRVTAMLGLGYGTRHDIVFDVASSDPSVTVPATVTVQNRHYQANFYATAGLVTVDTPVTITVSSGGVTVATASFTVRPLFGSLAFAPASPPSGGTSQGTITLDAPVASDMVVALSSGDPAVTVPATVTVPAGSKTVKFTATTSPVATPTDVVVSATINGKVVTGVLHLKP